MTGNNDQFETSTVIIPTVTPHDPPVSRNAFGRCAMSIIIPAHNEEAVLGRCLRDLLNGARQGELDIIVVCNGCTDQTAEVARSFGRSVRVLETSIPSKITALNMGDRAARVFPRFYVDADVVLTIGALRNTAAALRAGMFLAAAPEVEWNLRHSNCFVRAFYAVWQLQPYFDAGRLGAGVYALSEAGHARLGEFPQITADDEYVRRLFLPEERVTVTENTFQVTPPRTLRDLIKIKTRSRRGNLELVQKFPHLSRPARESRWKFLARIAVRPWLWLSSLVYFAVVAQTSVRARRTLKRGGAAVWERDLSSRVNVASESKDLLRS
ncbi:MAG: glycosyl transferase [Planctomycetaceae bacterium]|nr:glycosyl transferase [Planctomycetaceae bacterium]